MVANNWAELRIGELGEVFTGRTPPTEHPCYFGEGFPFITPGDMHQGKYARKTQRSLSHEGADLLKRIKLPANSVCVSCIGWQMGEVVMTDKPSFSNQQINTIVPNSKVDASFLYYSLRTRKQELLSLGSATGVRTPILNKSSFCDTKVVIPPLPTQRHIAGILSAYDDLIENNQRRIRILEEMACSLYREWFVHFRYPGHESVSFVDSPLGQIPQGWEVLEFRSVFEIKYGKTLPKTEISESGQYPVYGAGDVIGYYDKLLCPKKCALVTSRGNGSGTVWRTRGAAFVTNNSLIIVPQKQVGFWSYPFIELLLKHSNVMAAKTGSAQPQVTIENLSYVQAIVPPRELVEKFCTFAIPVYEQVDSFFEKCSNLRRTSDLLLPRLLSGQVNLGEAES